MIRDESGYVTVEHAVCFVAVTLVVGVLVAAAQAGLTGSRLCQAVRDGARAASIEDGNPYTVASASYPRWREGTDSSRSAAPRPTAGPPIGRAHG